MVNLRVKYHKNYQYSYQNDKKFQCYQQQKISTNNLNNIITGLVNKKTMGIYQLAFYITLRTHREN